MQVVPVAAVLPSPLDNIEVVKLSFHVPVKMGERKKEFQFCWNSFFICIQGTRYYTGLTSEESVIFKPLLSSFNIAVNLAPS